MRKNIETIYLAGPLENVSEEYAFGWRRKAYDLLVSMAIVPLIPGQEQIKLSAKQIVALDAAMIRNADALLVNLDFLTQDEKLLGTGTIAELGMAHAQGKLIFGFTNEKVITQYKFIQGLVGKYYMNLDAAIRAIAEVNVKEK